MSEFKGTPWACEVSEPDYLGGIRSGVTVRADDGRPVAYAFNEAEGRVLAAASELLKALIEARRELEAYELERSGEHYNSPTINAAIAKALGEGQ